MEQEIWKDIPGYELLYQCSNMGNIKRKDKISTDKRKRRGNIIYGKILNPQKRGNGKYLAIDLCKDGNIKSYRVNRIVASCFLGLDLKDNDLCVCHKNDNIYDNNVKNLFLGTHEDNMKDMVNKGRQGGLKNKGENNGMIKYNDDILIKCIIEYIKGTKIKDISEKFNIKLSSLEGILYKTRRVYLWNDRVIIDYTTRITGN